MRLSAAKLRVGATSKILAYLAENPAHSNHGGEGCSHETLLARLAYMSLWVESGAQDWFDLCIEEVVS